MEEKKYLDYFRDKDDNYIIRRVWSQDGEDSYFVFSGTFNTISIIEKQNMEQEIEKIFESVSDGIELNAITQYKISRDSFLFEKILGNFEKEEKFNPLFSKMTKEEALEFQGDSIKVKIHMSFEIHIKVEKHLKFRAFKEMLFGKTKTEIR